ncbi:MAG TPA: Na/Pi cotransporter family protein [Acetobacteraceae bacterium]|nr:Na/Pi cotransporter family protein [Acetobacteraceae bacterium]
MNATLTLVDLAGTVALLLWGVRMVQTGIQRAFGPDLRRILAMALGNRLKAFAAGLGVTAILQSSTATGLMVSSFAAGGLVDLVPALAVMLGANLGTTLIVQVLSFDVSRAASGLVLIGVIMFRRGQVTRARDLGRVAIGLGLMLMALHQLLAIVSPVESQPLMHSLFGLLASQPVMAVLLAAVLTWAAHSSVAVVLLVMSLAARGVVPPEAALALVLGANLGTAINPLLEGVQGEDPAARRVPIGNLVNRIIGVALALLLLGPIGRLVHRLDASPAQAVADFHTLFNLVLAVVFLPVLAPYARALKRFLPSRIDSIDPARPLYLDESAQENPPVALAGAAREALRMADVLETMLAGAVDALVGGDRKRIEATRRMDDVLDRLNSAIKAYLTMIDPEALTEADHARLSQILTFAMNLEHAGDVLDKNLMSLANKRLKRGLAFSAAGEQEIRGMLQRLSVNLRGAAAVFMTEDARAARQLVAEKEAFRDLEATATEGHFARLRAGRIDSTETSALHLDVLRDLKRVNAHLVAAAAYPVLEGQGALLHSRLRTED